MSNGNGEGGSQRRELHGKRKLFQGIDFSYAIARMAVAQICESVKINVYQESQTREGVRFSSFHESALDSLTGVAVHYIQSLGNTAQLYANVAGRVEGNSLDIVQALEDLGSGLGFNGVSDTNHCLADSPLRFVEKEMSPVFPLVELSNEVVSINHVPDKHMSNNHHIPVLEASAPSHDINKRNKLAEYENGEKKGGARPQQTLLRFKIGNLKRPSCLAMKQSVQENKKLKTRGRRSQKSKKIVNGLT